MNIKKYTIIIAFCLAYCFVSAQKENNMWYFGKNAALDFNSGSPVEDTSSAMFTIEGCTSISDSVGNLLFYSNGEQVWDKNHVLMPNGDSLAGHQSATQSLIVPFPNNPDQYYLFYLDAQFASTNFNFYYSIIDMSLNGGFGDVTVKDVTIRSGIAEKISGVKHANGNDIWVMVHGYGVGNDSLFAYLVTPAGILSQPVVSKIGQAVNGLNSLGYMKFSPDGTKLAFASRSTNFVDLFDFDASTGIVTNEKYLTLPPPWQSTFGAYGLEFSSNGNYLYATELRNASIYQWDVTSNNAATINSTLQNIGSSPGSDLGALQMGPDGKIYQVKSSTPVLGVINNPDLPGTQANFVDTAIVMNRNNGNGLPGFVVSSFKTLYVSEKIPFIALSIYPNPFNSEISIEIEKQNSKPVSIEIKNIIGQTVFYSKKCIPFDNNISINLSFLNKGIYLVDIIAEEGRATKKIVKD